LYNAWHAGVPALLAPEYAFQQIRKSDLDYLEVNTIEKVKESILKLKNNSELYHSIVVNGQNRATEFTQEVILKKWEDFLFTKLPKIISSPSFKRKKLIPLWIKIISRRLKRYADGRTKR